MKKMTGFLCCLALAGLMSAPANAKAQDIPTLGVLDVLQQVADNEGKVVMLNFFASWCGPCKLEIPGLIRVREDISEDDLVIIGLSADEDPVAMMEYINGVDFNYPVFHAAVEVSQAFQIDAIPFNVIYSKEGEITYAESGLLLESLLRFLLDQQLDPDMGS